ncbi:MAG: DNA polymerase III subunit delta' [Desulfosarcina sp.]|nr:DNA polymerase III subunit delta' [Desulfobacterales bacterium]
MPGFESILDQKQPAMILSTLFHNGTVPHALLFTGIEGAGKTNCAMVFAMLCNCLKKCNITGNQDRIDFSTLTDGYCINPCGSCKACKKIESGNHPDIILIKPNGNFIRIEQIRDLGNIIALKPYEAKIRVVIISDVQHMTPEASNALLKSLEEPPERTMFILTASQVSDLVPTIVSRCQHIRFNPVSLKSITSMLVAKFSMEQESAETIASLAGGSFSKALKLARTQTINWINYRKWLLDSIAMNHFTGESAETERAYGLIFALADKLSKNKDLLFESLEMIETWLRDVAIYKYSPDKVINIDMIENVKYVSMKVSIKSLISKIKAIHKARKNIRANANPKITLDILILRLVGA